jgi:steroid 5-alpha reductase family enzyme
MRSSLTLAVILFLYTVVCFVVSLIKKRNDVADVAWGPGFVLLAWASFFLSDAVGARGLLAGGLVSAWGLRLAWHLRARNRGQQEDYRYRAWRQAWGRWFFLRSYLQVYLLQGALMPVILLPVLLINRGAGSQLGALDAVGIAVWLVGFVLESAGDAQLKRFLEHPENRGKVMQEGLWRYSRHPNYFGEVVQWWGLWIMALSVPYGWAGIVGPATITFLILKVSGVPLLEKRMAEHPEFAEYRSKTSMFIPWFRKER